MVLYRRKRGSRMQISSRFTLAVHILTFIAVMDDRKITSSLLASSTNINPVMVRRILGQLKNAGIVEVTRGTGGARLCRPLSEITFWDIYKAVDCVEKGELFHFHEKPNEKCPIGCNIHAVLDNKLLQVQQAMEKKLASITMADVKNDMVKRINKNML